MNVRAIRPIFTRTLMGGKETLQFVPAGMSGIVSELSVMKGEPIVHVDWTKVFMMASGQQIDSDDVIPDSNINTVSPADIHYYHEDN